MSLLNLRKLHIEKVYFTWTQRIQIVFIKKREIRNYVQYIKDRKFGKRNLPKLSTISMNDELHRLKENKSIEI